MMFAGTGSRGNVMTMMIPPLLLSADKSTIIKYVLFSAYDVGVYGYLMYNDYV